MNERHSFKLIHCQTIDYPCEIRDLLLKIINRKVEVKEISFLQFAISKLYSESLKIICKNSGLTPEELHAIGIHGQTVWHQPEKVALAGMNISSTLQLGSPSALAQLLNLPVVADFRAADIALCGQGAPLVPIFDYEFLRSSQANFIALNIGGISNITYMPANALKSEILAFDCGPGNVLIDSYTKTCFNKNYDKDGEIARSGKLILDLYDALKEIRFIRHKPPKSTGRELFNNDLIKKFLVETCFESKPKEDILNTLTQFTAYCIAENIRLYARHDSNIIASGGGVRNKFLMELLKKELPEANIVNSDSFGIPSDYKEALCFAYLAYRTLGGLTSNITNVTGAVREAVLGTISLP